MQYLKPGKMTKKQTPMRRTMDEMPAMASPESQRMMARVEKVSSRMPKGRPPKGKRVIL